MKNEQAINELKDWQTAFSRMDKDMSYAIEAFDMAIEALFAQPEQHWIPCSKRLPKKDGRYQVTRYDYVTNTEFIDILWYEKNTWWDRQATGDYAVTAWMPLPEPYKEEHDG